MVVVSVGLLVMVVVSVVGVVGVPRQLGGHGGPRIADRLALSGRGGGGTVVARRAFSNLEDTNGSDMGLTRAMSRSLFQIKVESLIRGSKSLIHSRWD